MGIIPDFNMTIHPEIAKAVGPLGGRGRLVDGRVRFLFLEGYSVSSGTAEHIGFGSWDVAASKISYALETPISSAGGQDVSVVITDTEAFMAWNDYALDALYLVRWPWGGSPVYTQLASHVSIDVGSLCLVGSSLYYLYETIFGADYTLVLARSNLDGSGFEVLWQMAEPDMGINNCPNFCLLLDGADLVGCADYIPYPMPSPSEINFLLLRWSLSGSLLGYHKQEVRYANIAAPVWKCDGLGNVYSVYVKASGGSNTLCLSKSRTDGSGWQEVVVSSGLPQGGRFILVGGQVHLLYGSIDIESGNYYSRLYYQVRDSALALMEGKLIASVNYFVGGVFGSMISPAEPSMINGAIGIITSVLKISPPQEPSIATLLGGEIASFKCTPPQVEGPQEVRSLQPVFEFTAPTDVEPAGSGVHFKVEAFLDQAATKLVGLADSSISPNLFERELYGRWRPFPAEGLGPEGYGAKVRAKVPLSSAGQKIYARVSCVGA